MPALQLPTVPVVAVARDERIEGLEGGRLPPRDLFIKPIDGRGGRGAERWDFEPTGTYRNGVGERLGEASLRQRLTDLARTRPQIIQPRISNCDDLADLNNGALSTVRILTCLDERDQPEVVSAVLRMAINNNSTVDNIHAGGIAAEIDLATGTLGSASNLGMDAALGWHDIHPNTGATIRGRQLLAWRDVRRLARRAHDAFADRVVVGWDTAKCAEGPLIVEGNSGPDVDLMQRPSGRGLLNSRLGELIAHHLQRDDGEASRAS